MQAKESVAVLAAAVLVASLFCPSGAAADTLTNQIDAQDQEIAQLNAEIAQYQAEIKAADTSKQTLQSAIGALNLQISEVKTQITATQAQINLTNLKIEQLGTGIASAQESIDANQAALEEDVRSLEETDDQPLVMQLFSANGLSEAWSDTDQVLQVQDGIQNAVMTLETQKSSLTSSKAESEQEQSTLTVQKKMLTAQQRSLSATENSKTQLLAETNSQEATYEKLLAAAQAEIASFSTFAANAGGSGILYNQTICDAWGCYYNQRDSQWGNDALDGTRYTMKSDGCLVTSMAMVMTHYGYTDVTPITINSNPADFAVYAPYNLLSTIPVAGVTVTRKTTAIDATLSTGNPVIVGLYAYGGTHFVVLTSGSHGNYLMRDPYQPNAIDVSFSKYYSLRNIFSVAKVVITS